MWKPDLRLWTAASVSQPCGLYAPGMSWSDADASVVIVRLQWLSTSYKTTPETQANTVVSERDQDKTTRTVSCYKTTVLVLAGVRCINTWLSHRLEIVTACLQGTFVNQALIGGFSFHFQFPFPYFRFRTSVSVLRFPFQHFPLALLILVAELYRKCGLALGLGWPGQQNFTVVFSQTFSSGFLLCYLTVPLPA